MFYRYDAKNLEYVKISWPTHIVKIGIASVILIIIVSSSLQYDKKQIEKQVMVIMKEHDQFTEERLVDNIKGMNFKFPYIVYAQALLETNHFKSIIFKENNNLFGMKEATQRIYTSKGSQNGHAYYTNWMNSLYDYGFYCATYLSSIKQEDEYYNYLSQSYAEDKNYVDKLKLIIERDNLKSKFN